jgi:hypothetical protein
MVFSPNPSDADERLDAPRWRLPVVRYAALIRVAVVAALLCVAAAVLIFDVSPAPVARSVRPARGPAGAARARSAVRPVAPPGTVGLPLRIPDAGVVTVVRPGQRLDVLAGTAEGRPAQVLAANVLVLRATARGDAPEDGALLYLAVSPEQATRVAGVSRDTQLTVTVRAP